MISQLVSSPTLVRVIPYALFLGLTFLQDRFGDAGRYWVYLLKTLVGAAMLIVIWRHVKELEWRFSWEAVAVGVAVFVLWIGIDPLYPKPKAAGPSWNPHQSFGTGSALAWFFIVVRIAGKTLVVPPLEEVFFRSFLYRYLWRTNFLSIPLNKWIPLSFVIAAAVFAAVHREWLAAVLCAFIYQGLVLWKNRLGDVITAHAITNLLLGLWVVWRGEWHFW